MFKPVSSKLDVPALEREQIEVWRERRTMERYLARNEASERRFSFLDGPITANNPMGVHHAWGRTYKDLYQRYHTMLGERQRYQNGFDCQGLWIEVEVEKELGFNNKRQIEEFGIDRFVELCKARVNTFAALQTEQSKRLGMWMDWEHSYFTNSDENNYTIWAFLKECHARGLIYKGHDVMPWCPRCGTGLSNMEIATEGYREIRHLSLTLRLPITSPGHDGEDLLVWTTTPWTLSSNVAAAVHPQLAYALVEGADGRRSWVSRGSLPRVMPDATVVREAPGSELLGLTYRGPFDELPIQAGVEHRVIAWDEVSDEEGTGIVHIAPGCGQEDFALAKRDGLPVLDPIDEFGIFRDGYGWQTGRFAGATEDAGDRPRAADVAADLERKGLLVSRERYLHHYPVCWRCGTQLVFRLVDEWFIAMDPLREPISARDAPDQLAAVGDRAGGARARLAAKHERLDDQQEALLRAGAADLGVRRLRRLGGDRVARRAAGARRRRLGGVRRAFAAQAVHRRGGDRLHLVRRPGAARRRRRQPVARRGDRQLQHARLEHRSRGVGEVVPGRLHHRGVPRPVPQLVLRPADDVDGAGRRADDADDLRLRHRPRRARRGDAQEQGERHPVRRGGRADRRRRHALDVLGRQPGRST